MALWFSTRCALHSTGKGIHCTWMLVGLLSCTVYDEAALERRASSTSERKSDVDAGAARVLEPDAAVGCDRKPCVTRSIEALDGSMSDASPRQRARELEHEAFRDAANEQPLPDGDPAPHVDAGGPAGRTHDDKDAAADGAQEESDARVADAQTESGFCGVCDSRPSAPPVLNDSGGTGNVTTYGSVTSPMPSPGGACNYGATDIQYYAAINVDARAGDANGQWQGGRICGQCAAVRVKTPEGWKETVVRIVDKCSDANCGIAVSGAAARDLMGDRPGRYDGDWRFVSCAGHAEASDSAPALHVKEGSSTWWSLVQVRNPAWAVTGIDWRSSDGASSGSFSYASEAENFYSVPEAVHGHGMVRLLIRYRDDSQVEVVLAPSQLAQPAQQISLP